MKIDIKNQAKKIVQKSKVNFEEHTEKLQNTGKTYILVVILALILMFAIALAVFFSTVQGAERVLVPDVVGKELTTALLELQAKELYPKIQLKYSEEVGDQGTILDQSPDAGAIVKAYRRITLTVSRGFAVDNIEDYSGKKIDEVQERLYQMFPGAHPLIKVAVPVFITSEAEEGTILAQYPEAGTPVVDPVQIQFVVSSGENVPMAKVTDMVGMNIKQVLEVISNSKVIYDFSSVTSEKTRKNGIVVSQEKADEVPYSTRLGATFEFKVAGEKDEVLYGIYSVTVPEYPHPVPMSVTMLTPDGKKSTLVEFSHPGKIVTVPYEARKGSTLKLYIMGDEFDKFIVE